MPEFDVFLSYSRNDNQAVVRLAETLRRRGLKVWFDKRELRPGLPWLDGLAEGIKASKTIAIFIGPSGLGEWEIPEVRLALRKHVEMGIPVIPVILPGSPKEIAPPHITDFLMSNTWVDFRGRELDDESTIDNLEWGITGKKPLDLLSEQIGGKSEDP